MAWLNKANDTRQAWRHRLPALLTILNKFLLYPQSGHINKQTNIARITRLGCVHINTSTSPALYGFPYFVPNFVAMATGVGRGKCDWQHSMAHPRKPPYRRKNLADISYTSHVIAHFVKMSLPWQRRLVGGKCDLQHSMARPSKPPYRRKNLADIFYTDRVIAHFVPDFVVMATRESPG